MNRFEKTRVAFGQHQTIIQATHVLTKKTFPMPTELYRLSSQHLELIQDNPVGIELGEYEISLKQWNIADAPDPENPPLVFEWQGRIEITELKSGAEWHGVHGIYVKATIVG